MESCAVRLRRLLKDGGDFSTVETCFRDCLMEAGREALGLAADYMDDGEQSIEIGGKVWHRASSAPKTVTRTLGKITYRRGCCRQRGERRQHC
ncbi:MAG: hypothetical protein OXB95_10825 [Rhodobacteraceae bacterium]|nr:hypothetical protein [Paracoccaceae bacterium]